MTERKKSDPDEVHYTFEFRMVIKNSKFAIGLLGWSSSNDRPLLWGLTNCTPDQLKKLVGPPKSN